MFKFYSLTQAEFDSEVRNAKLPLQQKQIYAALVRLGKPVRGSDAVANAVEHGLQTKQRYDVLAAWYFSPKRRPACVRMQGDATPVEPESKEARIQRLQAELARLTAEDIQSE